MIREAVRVIADTIIEEKNYLSMLDTKIGDGDHGLNMARGATAAIEAVEELDEDSASDLSIVINTVGKAFIMNVGGAAGPLYGTGFVEGSKALTKDSKLDADTLEKFFIAAVAGIKRRGHATLNDKTMLDVLIPIQKTISENKDKPLKEIMDMAMTAAREGIEHTKKIIAKRGRASYIGERSLGFEDPGAVSSMIIFKAFCQILVDENII